jgi:DNA-directed RNA polymerase specialized sigma24 family protein
VSGDSSQSQRADAGRFEATRWSIVLAAKSAKDKDTMRGRDALGKLCAAYWYPLHAFVRRGGKSAHDAQELTQGFFALLLEKNWLDGVDRSRGRFRSWLLAAMKYFLANEWDKSHAQKRGSGQMIIPLADGLADNQLPVLEYPKATVTVRSALVEIDGGARRQFVVCGTKGTFDIRPIEPASARLALDAPRGEFKKGYQDLTFPKMKGRYDGDFADFAKVIRGEKAFAFSPEHDLAVQQSVLLASGLPVS